MRLVAGEEVAAALSLDTTPLLILEWFVPDAVVLDAFADGCENDSELDELLV